MTSFIIRRLLLGIIVLIVVSILIFLLMRLLPGDPLLLYVGSDFNTFSQEQLDALRHEYNLDKPLITQYFMWIGGVLHGDLGKSIVYQQNVSTLVVQRLPVTFNLGVFSFMISAIFGLTFGTICAVKRGKWADTLFSVIANLGITLPNFWVGILLIYLFSLKLNLLPTYGYTSPFKDLGLNIQMLIMPVFTLSLFGTAGLTRQTRSSMLEVTRQDYIRTAWAKGLRERLVVIRHMIKNGLIPVVTTMGMQISFMFGGSVLVETVFNVPGMGRMMKDAVMSMDYQVVQGGVLVIALVVVLTNIVVDIVYGWIDPRIRYS
jgi:peptide/nickel transport system permease protein